MQATAKGAATYGTGYPNKHSNSENQRYKKKIQEESPEKAHSNDKGDGKNERTRAWT